MLKGISIKFINTVRFLETSILKQTILNFYFKYNLIMNYEFIEMSNRNRVNIVLKNSNV